MTLFRDYSKNGELLDERNEPISDSNLDRFRAEYNNEYVQGYMQCLNDFINEIVEVVYNNPGNIKYVPNTPAITQKKLKKYFDEKRFLLEHFESRGITLQQPLDRPNPM